MIEHKSGKGAPSFTFTHLALLLLCGVLVTCYMMGGLYAKYSSKSEGSASARVIYFGDITITETGDEKVDGKYLVIPGVDINKKATVDFAGSESSTYVFVEVTVSENWQSTDGSTFSLTRSASDDTVLLSWAVADDWALLSGSGRSWVYYYKGEVLKYNTPIEDSDIIANGTLDVSELITAADITGGVFADLSITFQASAVQSIGFASAAEAWASLSAKGGIG